MPKTYITADKPLQRKFISQHKGAQSWAEVVVLVREKIAKLERLAIVFEGYRDSNEPFVYEASDPKVCRLTHKSTRRATSRAKPRGPGVRGSGVQGSRGPGVTGVTGVKGQRSKVPEVPSPPLFDDRRNSV